MISKYKAGDEVCVKNWSDITHDRYVDGGIFYKENKILCGKVVKIIEKFQAPYIADKNKICLYKKKWSYKVEYEGEQYFIDEAHIKNKKGE